MTWNRGWIHALIFTPIAALALFCGPRPAHAATPQNADTAAAALESAALTTTDALAAQVNAELRLLHSQIVSLDVNPAVGADQVVQFPLDDAMVTLDLTAHSVRDPQHYRVLLQLEDGSYFEAEPAPIRTLRGALREISGSAAAASLLDDGLYGTVLLPGGDQYWFEPLAGRFAGALPGDYVLYRSDDAFGSPGPCGNADQPGAPADDVQFGQGSDDGSIAGSTLCTAQLACDADREYYVAYGSSQVNVQNRINLVINTVNLQYTTQTDITHLITTIIIRTAEPDPYSSADSGTLLTQFRNEWIANQGAVVRDVAKLFTGRSISGGIIGQAWAIGGICTTSGYCYSWSDCCGSLGCATDLAAHELGHLWSATHCTCSSPASTMNPFITCANTFSAGSISQVVAYRNTRTCLDCGGAGGPANNACASATAIGNGSFTFDTALATTDGPDEPTTCNFFSYTQVGSDIWYRYTASCTGTVNVDVCTANYDTKIAVYGSTCPTAASAIACNDDACGTDGTRSQLTFPGTAGTQYLIRVGGYNALTGTGTLTVSCTPSGPANDPCAAATPIGNGTFPFSTVTATTDGPDEPGACNFAGYTQVGSDIWYRYTATPCAGTVTVSLCDATYDSKVAIYAGATCPSAATAIACNDDACGTSNLRSTLTFTATSNGVYLIRVGGYNGLTGTGSLVVLSAGNPPTINTQPTNQSACSGGSATFSVAASGTGTLTYQWRRNTVNVGGATSSSLTINPANAGNAGNYDVIVTDACGSTTSNTVTLTVNSAPSIAGGGQPVGQTVCQGSPVTFTVTAGGTAPLSYQWQKNTVNIGGATSSSYSIASAVQGDAGSYRCVVSNSCGSLTSASATLAVNVPPTINVPPSNQSICSGDPATFTILATGTAPLTYQWQKNAVDIGGATTNAYSIPAVAPGDAGSYRCVVTNACGSATSTAATLTVNPCGCPAERGDANCSGVIDFFDIDPFLVALFDLPTYTASYCGGAICTVDVDCSGTIDFFDIDPLLTCLFAACPPCP